MAYSSAYPIYHDIAVPGEGYADYGIEYKGEKIFEGRVYARGASAGFEQIDIAPICREYLNTNYSALLKNVPTPISAEVPTDENNRDTIGTFTVGTPSSDDGKITGGKSYVVKYDYNTDYILEVGNSGNLNEPISDMLDTRQYLPISAFNLNGTTTVEWTVGETTSNSSCTSQNINLMAINLRTAEEGDIVTATNFGVKHTFRIVSSCRNRYVLYYVNKYGGLDSLLCSGKAIKSWSPYRTDVNLYSDKRDRLQFEQTRIHAAIDQNYQLTTGLLNDEQAQRIDNLIYSPKVFIHELDTDYITSCLITDTDYRTKNRRQDKQVYYEINVKQSQQLIRR